MFRAHAAKLYTYDGEIAQSVNIRFNKQIVWAAQRVMKRRKSFRTTNMKISPRRLP